MTAPLCDSRGKIRYFIGAQVDVSGLVKECPDLESFDRLVNEQHRSALGDSDLPHDTKPKKDEFRDLTEMFNATELETIRLWGGHMHREQHEQGDDNSIAGASHRPRLLLKDQSHYAMPRASNPELRSSGRLGGVYQNVGWYDLSLLLPLILHKYLLVRPYPALRILFASPTLRVPGISQYPFMDKIGGSSRVRAELTAALAEGRGVTAKIRWITKKDDEGRPRWIHCTPLLGSNGAVGVWMIVVIDDESDVGVSRRWKQAPPVDPALSLGSPKQGSIDPRQGSMRSEERFPGGSSVRSSSPFSVRIV